MKKILFSLMGKFTWEKPTWLFSSKGFCQKNPKKALAILIGIIFAIALTITGYWFYQKLPKPQILSAHIYLPNITLKDQKQIAEPLSIVFDHTEKNSIIDHVTQDNNEIVEDNYISVAPLKQVGRNLTQGVEIKPAIAGLWQWKTDKILEFIPASPWSAGTQYTVSFSKSLFDQTATSYRMSPWHIDFTTNPIAITVDNFKFFQDIINPKLYKVAATLNFNYPLESNSLISKIHLVYLVDNKPVPFKVSYSSESLAAYIEADILYLPEHSQYLQLNIDKDIKPEAMGNPTESMIQSRIMIPDKTSIMKINKISAVIVRNNNDQPEQVITVDTSAITTTEDLAKFMHVYMLPRDYPATGSTPIQEDYEWHTPGEVNKNWLTQKVDISPIPTEHDFETSHSFKVHVTPGRYLYIAIDKGLSSSNPDYTLALDYATIIQAPEYPKEINFLHQGSLLTLTGEKKISVIIRGLPAVKFTIARVLPDEINHLITQTSGNFQNPQFINYNFDSSNISIITSKIETFNNEDQSKAQYMALDLAKYLQQQPFKLGLFLLKAEGYDPVAKTTTDTSINRLILITDNDMLVKNNAQGSHDVFVHSMTGGTPVTNAQVSVLSKNGLTLMSQTTDNNGHAQFPTFKDFTNDKAPTVYLVSKGNDISFMPYSRYDRFLNYSRFNTGGDTSKHKYGLNAFLFSDRGIYRPGEKMQLGLIVKGDFASGTIPDLPMELIITDPRGKTVYDKKLSSNAIGLLSESYMPDSTALTGTYSVALYVTKDNSTDSLLGTSTFQVQEFEPDQLKISAKFNPQPVITDGWVSPKNLTAEVQLWNLFGTPAVNHRITGKLYFAPQTLKFNAYPDIVFNDPYRDLAKSVKVFSENLSDSQTDAKGQATFNLDLSRYSQSTYQLTLLTHGFVANGGRGVSQTTSVLVSPLDYLIGYKTEGNLSYIRQNSKSIVHFIAINPQLKKILLKNLTINLLKLNNITTLVKQADGSYSYQTVIQTHKINNAPFIITESGNNYLLPTDQVGDYKIQVNNSEGLLLSEVSFSIIGQADHAASKNPTLILKLNKHDYAPGETIQLNITAPYAGSGLITIERDKVYAYKWFKMNGTSKIESITIPADFEGTGYINIALIRDWNSDEIFMNPLSFSVQNFSVIPDPRRMKITLNVPEHVYPGTPLKINYSTNKPGNIIIYAVDEGILQVADYQTPDPIAYYFQKQALSVDTAQIADQILPKYIANRELSAIGGDERQKAIASNLNPFARKLAPVVYWSGIINSDSKLNSVIYNIPDYFNGTLRVMAVAVSPDAVGAQAQKLQVRNDYILLPNVPAFVAAHDQFEVSLNIANTTHNNSLVKLQIKPSSLIEVNGPSQQSVVVPANSESTVIFKLKAKDLLGVSDLTFIALVANKSFERKISLSVRPITPYQTTINSGYATSAQDIAITRALYPQLRTLDAVSSTNPFILLKGLQNYLATYPYNCTEQLISQALIGLTLKNQPGYTNDTESLDATYNKIIQMLRQRQTSDGSFTYWPSGLNQTTNPFINIYVADFLTEANIRGYNVPSDLFSHVLAYLKDYATTIPNSISDARLHAYAVYVLTRNEIVTTDYIANLQTYFEQKQDKTWVQDITSVYLAASYKMLQNTAMANKLILSYQMHKDTGNNDDFYNMLVMDAEYITILANYFPDRLMKLKGASLMPLVNNLSSNNMNSLIAATSALALSNFAKIFPSENMDSKLSIAVIDKNNHKQRLTTSSFGPDVNKVSFDSENHTPYFYQVTQAGFDHDVPNQDIKSGMEVYREYQNDKGIAITSTIVGNEVEVHLRIRATNNQAINNIAIVDLLPGGFELVTNSITPLKNAADYLNYYDVREDRIIFYVTATADLEEYTYRIRATNKGSFNIPPIFATSMYNPQIVAEQKSGIILVQ